MIIIKSLKWSNWFSYGADNYINFEDTKLLQVTGYNGSGKTSIPIVIEEVFYGKNSKGIKKQNLINRYLEKVSIYAELIFSKDNYLYTIKLQRKTTAKLILLKNGIDISSHTVTNTYKTIQSILGMDFNTFTQLIYQSSNSNLEFLTSTDTNRKKFLISLFNLDKYLEVQDVFKKAYTLNSSEYSVIKGKLSTIKSWIDKNECMDFTKQDILELPLLDNSIIDNLSNKKIELSKIDEINKNINKNNQYKELLSLLNTDILNKDVNTNTSSKLTLISEGNKLNKIKIENVTKINSSKSIIFELNKLGDVCHSCKQDILPSNKSRIIDEHSNIVSTLESEVSELDNSIISIKEELSNINNAELFIEEKNKVAEEFVKLNSLIDNSIASESLNAEELKEDIQSIKNQIFNMQNSIKEIANKNSIAEKTNSRIQVIKTQLDEYKESLYKLNIEYKAYSDKISRLEILKKAFSTSGLVSYKIDYLVRDLEVQINNYLSTLSGGKFQLIFILEGDKLNIKIVDEGIQVNIEELSAGELARINASTLLAIRKLMAAISSTKINLLFLDEILGVLDTDGKEKLIDVLSEEKELNTFLVSHEFTHPLIPKINIVKEDKISRVEYG